MEKVKPIIPTFEKYAIFQTGGMHYQAIPGKTVAIEKLDAKVGDTVEFSEVLFRKNGEGAFEFGAPYVEGAALKASIVKHIRGPKLIVYRRKRRKKSRVKKGHRQPISIFKVVSIGKKKAVKTVETKPVKEVKVEVKIKTPKKEVKEDEKKEDKK